jgi:aminopeptidase N
VKRFVFFWFSVTIAVVLAGQGPASGHLTDCPHSFDVLHYGITLHVDIDAETVAGHALVRAQSEVAGLETIGLDFAVLTVDSVLGAGGDLVSSHVGQDLSIDLGRAYAAGDTFEVVVHYHGHPGNIGPDNLGGFYFEGVPKRAMQVGRAVGTDQPSMGKYLFPCWDRPCDKATADLLITVVGTGKRVICNGVLQSAVVDSTAGTATYHWVEDRPVATHRVALHAGKYADLVDSTYGFIHYFVYPRQAEEALINFENVPAMMDVLVGHFGPYPFAKCAYVSAPQADVAHQNCITYPASAVTPVHSNDWHVAEGLTRQWWGACVGIADWRDVWLCESFGRYGQPLFEEQAYGSQAYHDYIYYDLMLHTFADADEYSPVYDPTWPGGHTIYEKGTVVLHMLRYVLGDSVFFSAMRTFRDAYEYDVATTADFQAVSEAVSGRDLAWFFDEWIYDCGWPEYEYAWLAYEAGGLYEIDLVMDQVQVAGPVFTMPLEVGISTAAGDTLIDIWVDDAHEEFALAVGDEPLAVVLDPDRWVLHRATEVSFAGLTGGGEEAGERSPGLRLDLAPNPARSGVCLRYHMPAAGKAVMRIYDAAGREVATLHDSVLGPGEGEIYWDGRREDGGRAAAGAYFCRMATAAGSVSARIILVR